MKVNNEEIVYFSINDWSVDYHPNDKQFMEWAGYNDFMLFRNLRNDEWCKQEKICVIANVLEYSLCFNIAAPKQYVMEHCPSIIGSKFVDEPKDGEDYPSESAWGLQYNEYCEENFGFEMIMDDLD